jgi:hypothetical protein
MNLPRYLLTLLILLSCAGAEAAAQKPSQKTPKREWRDMIGTELTGKDCTPATAPEDEGARICKGVQGYSLLVKGDETKPDIFLIAPNGKRSPIEYWDKDDPRYRGMRNSVLWVVVHEPKTTVAIDFSLNVEPRQDYTQFEGYDVIARVSPGPVCIVGSVPPSSTAAGDSVGIATSPTGRPCLGLNELQKKDWDLTARRLATEGQIDEALEALKNVKKPSDRFYVYKDIVSAQLKTGDRESAHRTLMTARTEALKKPYVLGLEYTLIHVTAGLAEAGYDDEAKADVPLYEEHDQLRMRLMIAWCQGERKDFEAAKATYQEIIQLELARVPRNDGHLSDVCESQARMKLYDEARNTAALMIDYDQKRSCEDRIPKQPQR